MYACTYEYIAAPTRTLTPLATGTRCTLNEGQQVNMGHHARRHPSPGDALPGHASLLASEEAVNQMAPMAMSLMEAGYLKHHGRNIYDIYDGRVRCT